jgi:hypothetical protein
MACRGTGKLLVNGPALDRLQACARPAGQALIVRSAYRSLEHNRAAGGAKASKHPEGIAFDIYVVNHDPETFEAAARETGFREFGFFPRSGFMRIDLGPARSWGERFPKRAITFAAEAPPARKCWPRAGRSREAAPPGSQRSALPTWRSRSRCSPRRKARCCRWS